MSNYLCKRCNFTSKNFTDIKRHTIKNKKCSKKINVYNESDDHLFILSLIPYNNNNNQNIDINNITNKNNIFENKERLFECISNIEKNKLKKCEHCDKCFNKIQDLKNHIILYCFSNKIDEEKIKEENLVSNNITNNIVNNTSNVNNTDNSNNTLNATTNNTLNHITNNITINLKLDSLVPFDKDWDLSHINSSTKQALIISLVKYTKTLEQILKNENNMNVLLDKNSEKGFIYKDNNFEEMSKDDIIKQSFEKIYNHLKIFHEEVENNNEFGIDPEYLEEHRENLDIKFNKYNEDKESKNMINSCISEKFEEVKDKAYKNYKIINKYDIKGY